MPKNKDKERKNEKSEKIETKKESKKDLKKKEKEQKELLKMQAIENNIFNILFDEINGFLNDLPHIDMKTLKQKLILIDGKLLWLEKENEKEQIKEEGEKDIIDMEMDMLEKGMELETADELKMAYEPIETEFDLNSFKADIEEGESFGNNIKEIINELELDGIEQPIDDLLSKFILYDLRAILERAINEVFKLEGQIKKLAKEENITRKIEEIKNNQKNIVKDTLKELIAKLKKEKPKLILSEEKKLEFKKLTQKEIASLKSNEEQEFDKLVEDILKEN